jgi:nicotinamide-nucleotide amidase
MPLKKRLEIISLGDELLLGIRPNTHLSYLGRELSKRGLHIQRDQEIRDRTEDIQKYFLETWERTDILITTGGLGPTEDDITREAIADALGVKLIHSDAVEVAIRKRFALLGRTPAANNMRQAMVLEGAEVLPNPNGTAPGQWFERDGKILIMMPGPSHEMRPMFVSEVMPRLEARDIAIGNQAFLQLRTCGVGESELATKLERVFKHYHSKLNVAYCAHVGIVDVRFGPADDTLKWDDIERIGQQCIEIIGEDFVGLGECDLADGIIRHLRATEKTLAIAESCTGGLLSSAFTEIPGASKVFLGGLVCYNNDIKVGVLGVPEPILQQHGAVSAECAVAMATAATERFECDYALTITGYAGPSGGDAANPLGTHYLGFSSPVGVWSKTVRLTGNRMVVRQQAVTQALDWMRRKLNKYGVHDVLEMLVD